MEPFASLLNDPILNPDIVMEQPPQQQQQQQQPPHRKRPRSTSPHPFPKQHKQTVPDPALVALDLKDLLKRTDALQTLLKLSSSHDLNYTLGDAAGDQVLQALTHICYECLDYQRPV